MSAIAMLRYPYLIVLVLLGFLAASAGSAQTKPMPVSRPASQAAKDAELARFRVVDSSAALLPLAPAGTTGGEGSGSGSEPEPAGVPLGSIGSRRGDLDRFFGQGALGYPGRTTVPFDASSDLDDRAFGILVEADDRVLSIGRAGTLANGTRIGISRHLANGQLDPGFGAGGRQLLDVVWGGTGTQLRFTKAAGLLGSLNRFYVLGELELGSLDSDFVVLCLRRFGGSFSPCPDFGGLGNGMVQVAFDLGSSFWKDIPRDIFIDTINQKLLLAGTAQRSGGSPPGSDYDFAIARMDLFTGAPDTGFGSFGRMAVEFDLSGSSLYDVATTVHVRPIDNKIVVGGFAHVGLLVSRSAMAQLNADGTIDQAFCAPAVTSCASPASHRSGRRLWIDDAGLGFAQVVDLDGGDLNPTDTVVVREQVVTADNGRGRIERMAVDGGCSECSHAIFQSFQRIRPVAALMDYRFVPPFGFNYGVLVAGYSVFSDADNQFTHVTRVLDDMSLDAEFSSGLVSSQQFYDFADAFDQEPLSRPAALARDSKGRFLVAGASRWRETGNDWDFALARLQADVIFEHGYQ